MGKNFARVERVTQVTDEVLEASKLFAELLRSENQMEINRYNLERITYNPNTHWLMARNLSYNQIVGTATLTIMPMLTNVRAMLENVAVAEYAQGHGIGSLLCSRAVRIAELEGVNTVQASALQSNLASQAMLIKSGFIPENDLARFEFNIQNGPIDLSSV
jgi:RimJ/RimL family protein N-acetyltransferase